MIILDLEWNSGLYDNIRLDEILQIGAVKCIRPGGRILDTFCAYIRPRVHSRFSPAAELLPQLSEALSSTLTFEEALTDFLDWCAKDNLFAVWGTNDFPALYQNIQYWGLEKTCKNRLPFSCIDLQAAFADSVGSNTVVALDRAVEYCRIPDVFDPHDALSDAIYTWAVCTLVTGEEISRAVKIPTPHGQGKHHHHRQPSLLLPSRKESGKISENRKAM